MKNRVRFMADKLVTLVAPKGEAQASYVCGCIDGWYYVNYDGSGCRRIGHC